MVKKWLLKILDKLSADSKLLKRIGMSLSRDREFPLGYLLMKGWIMFKSLLTARLYLRKCDRVGRLPRTVKKPYIVNNGTIKIGDNLNLTSRSVQCDLVTYPEGVIEIGHDVFINFGTTVVAENRITIGNNVKIGPYSMIHDTDFHIPGEDYTHAEGKPITIEDNAWINARVLIMKGSVIGEGSVIAAGSVVSGIIPPYVVAGGVPARVIKKLETPDHTGKADGSQPFERIPLEVSERVRKIIAETFQIDTDEIVAETSPGDLQAWSARGHMRLIENLGESFNIDFTSDEAVRMSSFLKICRMIAKKDPIGEESYHKTGV